MRRTQRHEVSRCPGIPPVRGKERQLGPWAARPLGRAGGPDRSVSAEVKPLAPRAGARRAPRPRRRLLRSIYCRRTATGLLSWSQVVRRNVQSGTRCARFRSFVASGQTQEHNTFRALGMSVCTGQCGFAAQIEAAEPADTILTRPERQPVGLANCSWAASRTRSSSAASWELERTGIKGGGGKETGECATEPY